MNARKMNGRFSAEKRQFAFAAGKREVSKRMRILSAIKNPPLIVAHLQSKRRERLSERHKKRLWEYEKYVTDEKTALKKLFGKTIKSTVKIKMESALFPPNFNMDLSQGRFLYSCVRLLKPEIVLETGVANGISTMHMLRGLNDNRRGKLISIELRSDIGVNSLMPEKMRNRWELKYGNSVNIIPKITKNNIIDMFLHDSEHTYNFMISEYRLVWPFLRNRGMLISDDAGANDAFLDFADDAGRIPIFVRGRNHKSLLGIIRK